MLDLILDRLPATLLLMVCAFIFSVTLGILTGVIAARARYEGKRKWLDSAIMSGALLIYATPQFWLALLAVIFFSLTLGGCRPSAWKPWPRRLPAGRGSATSPCT